MRATAGGRRTPRSDARGVAGRGNSCGPRRGGFRSPRWPAERLLDGNVERWVSGEPAIDGALRRRTPIDLERSVARGARSTSIWLRIRPLSDEEGRFLGLVCALESTLPPVRRPKVSGSSTARGCTSRCSRQYCGSRRSGSGFCADPTTSSFSSIRRCKRSRPASTRSASRSPRSARTCRSSSRSSTRCSQPASRWWPSTRRSRIRRSPGGPSELAYFSFCCVRTSCPELPDGIVEVVIDTTGEVRAGSSSPSSRW